MEKLRGKRPSVMVADVIAMDDRLSSLEQMVRLESRAKLLNPKWHDSMLNHGYEGVREIEIRVSNTYGWSATADAVEGWVYDDIADIFLLDEAMRARNLPFHALVGLDAAQQALLLLAVAPRLRGLVVTASAGTGKGSMALHRMRQAKGAVNALLQKAYVNRDRVALIAFRGGEAELLMPPTQSVELARRALDLLPTGGGTPLASALLLADDVAQQAKSRGILQTVLLLLTDGRANISLRPDGQVQVELQQIGRYIAESPLQVMVVDTQRSYLSRGEARPLAEWLGGEYAYLPNASGEQIADLAAEKVVGERP